MKNIECKQSYIVNWSVYTEANPLPEIFKNDIDMIYFYCGMFWDLILPELHTNYKKDNKYNDNCQIQVGVSVVRTELVIGLRTNDFDITEYYFQCIPDNIKYAIIGSCMQYLSK